jgi:hypothetical protein
VLKSAYVIYEWYLRPTQRYLPSSVFSVLAFLKSKKVVVEGDISEETLEKKSCLRRNVGILIHALCFISSEEMKQQD